MSLNKFSRTLTQEVTNPAAKAMLYGIGLTSEDMNKAQIGIASTGYEGNPCNMHLNGLSVHVKKGIQENGMVGLVFHTIGVSDGMTNGNDGMSYSLPSRDIIADSIENVVGATAKALAHQLALDAGFATCIDFGKGDKVELLEKFALSWINLAILQGHGRNIAFKLLRR